MNSFPRKILLTCAICLLLCFSVLAGDAETMYDAEYCFSEADFCISDMGSVDGIFVTAVPEADVATLKLGSRSILAGDVLSAESLGKLRLIPITAESCDAVLCYLPIYANHVADPAEVTVRIQSGKNEAPKVNNVEFETYKNIANDGKLSAEDPEKGALTYQLVDAPKRGSVKLSNDGTFLYTPQDNKVGEDRFTYTATDEAGNVSTPATVNIRILNPTDKMTYSDMEDDTMHFEAIWMREAGLYGGKQLGSQLCFCPNETVSRSEFLVMAMELMQLPKENGSTAVFADCKEVPKWVQGYLSSALRHGIIRGESSQDGLCFYPDKPISTQEAAVMLQNMLQLPIPTSFSYNAYPAWSGKAVMALSDAGIIADYNSTEMTVRDVAQLLYQIKQL
ncbi:MAG: hypothetical protein E7434_02345 [Ruminococcaceae bacterium]|nr:hypothetical protein [Oscillospiraceae bacterium]